MLNWTRRLMADGVLFYPPEGRGAGVLRIRDRVRPLRRLRDLVAEHVRRLSAQSGAKVSASEPKRLMSAEGEHGASYEIAIETGADRVLFAVGIVFGDDFYTAVEAFCTVPDMFDTFRHATQHMATTLPLGLGSDRRRRYEYLPPASWQPVVKTHSVSWYPTDFPLNRSVIRVYDAKPANSSPPVILEKRLFEDPQNDLHAVTDSTVYECTTESQITGAYEVTRGMSIDGVEAVIIRVTLTDTRFAYNLRLESCEPHATAARAQFDDLVRTVVPVPMPTTEEGQSSLIQWAD